MTQTVYHQTKQYGWLELTLDKDNVVTAAVFVDTPSSKDPAPTTIAQALDAYEQTGTAIPTQLYQFPTEGTAFQLAIWRAIAAIPTGQTMTYTELAQAVGRPSAVRAAGTACGKNPLALFIPCHRIVRSQGEDFGYSWGPERKRALLDHEAAKT